MEMSNTFGIVRQAVSFFLSHQQRLPGTRVPYDFFPMAHQFFWKMSRKVYEMWFELMEPLFCRRLAL